MWFYTLDYEVVVCYAAEAKWYTLLRRFHIAGLITSSVLISEANFGAILLLTSSALPQHISVVGTVVTDLDLNLVSSTY